MMADFGQIQTELSESVMVNSRLIRQKEWPQWPLLGMLIPEY